MADVDLAAIKVRLAAATPGPYTAKGVLPFIDIRAGDRCVVHWAGFDSASGTKKQRHHNADFLAHSWEDIRDLLELVDALTEGGEAITFPAFDPYAELAKQEEACP